jgi:outer membrane immunogenic protein
MVGRRSALSVVLVLLAAIAAASPALAADLAVKAPVRKAAVAAFNWSGCYAGGNVGWLRSVASAGTTPTGPSTAGFSAAFLALNSHHYDLDDSAFHGGVQLGCNWQSGSAWILGLEGDFSLSGAKGSATTDYPILCFGCPTEWSAHRETLSHKLDWFSTARARLGFAAWERTMIYATGGLAIGHVKASFDYLAAGGLRPEWFGEETKTRYGWTVGGGVEHAFAGNWSAKLEYLYLDLGSFGVDATFVPNPCCAAGPSFVGHADFESRVHVVRLGLNYQFGWVGPVVARH